MDPATAHERKADVVFVDVRERYEFDAGHIEGSIHIPIMEIPQRVDEMPRDRTIVCVCQVGQRSDLTAQFLRDRGFDAHNLEGGVTSWRSEGYDLVGGTETTGRGEIVDGYARDFDGLINPQPGS